MFIATALWKIPFVARKWCWADAVMWALGYKPISEIEIADHGCFYCCACNTDEEMATSYFYKARLQAVDMAELEKRNAAKKKTG
jgi:hypothetical protein